MMKPEVLKLAGWLKYNIYYMKKDIIHIFFIITFLNIMFISFLYGQDTLIKQKKGILIKFSPYLLFKYLFNSLSVLMPLILSTSVINRPPLPADII